jgi:iron complex transport system permease protein
LLAGELNLLTIGEELAASRGVAVGRIKAVLFISVSAMVGVIVSVCGPVGFVGLMCPHICRMMVGANHRRLLPVTVLFGGAFLVACDTVARTLFAPTELPVGIFTSFLGGPFFLWLLFRTSGRGVIAE